MGTGSFKGGKPKLITADTVAPRCNGHLGDRRKWMDGVFVHPLSKKNEDGCCKDVAEVRLYIR